MTDHAPELDKANPENPLISFATDPFSSVENLGKYDCVEFRGSSGSLAVTGSDITPSHVVRGDVQGAVLLGVDGITGIGQPVETRPLVSSDPVDVNYINRGNARCVPRLGGTDKCGWKDIAVTSMTVRECGNIPDSNEAGQSSGEIPGCLLNDTNHLTEGGDSGTGIFQNGYLVGVLTGTDPNDLTGPIRLFVPIPELTK
jgi:hypothetical protein